jgi:hypothetical protein
VIGSMITTWAIGLVVGKSLGNITYMPLLCTRTYTRVLWYAELGYCSWFVIGFNSNSVNVWGCSLRAEGERGLCKGKMAQQSVVSEIVGPISTASY